MEAWYMQIKMKTKDRNEGKEKGSLIWKKKKKSKKDVSLLEIK